MSEKAKFITREELHSMVWRRPFIRLAKELGYSYPELVAICAKFDVPRPSGGYWYRQTHGGAEEPTPLPPSPSAHTLEIPLGSRPRQDDAPPTEPETVVQAEMEAVQDLGPERKQPVAALAKAAAETQVLTEPIRITREDLYLGVWKSTLSKLASELNTIRAEVVRACAELNVPRPDAAYWARLQMNLQVAVPPLPDPAPGGATECLMHRNGAPKPKPAGHAAGAAGLELPTKVEFTREGLYEAIWTKSCVKLAAELGISDVALAKTCRRMGIPRPSRGYWARIEAGAKQKREPLPEEKPGQRGEITFYVARNVARREEGSLNTVPSALQGVRCKTVELPPSGMELHPIAEKHRVALEKAKAGELGFVAVRGRNLFSCELSVAMVPLCVRALHAVLCELEDRDYEFKADSGEDGGLQIFRDGDQATLCWTEARVEVEREPTPEEKRKPSWTWQLKETKAAGVLSIEIDGNGLKGKRRWTAGEGRTLEEVLGVIVEKVEAVFLGYEKQRIREMEWAKLRAEDAKRQAEERVREAERQAREEKERKERDRIKAHEAELEEVAGKRRTNLATAASEWIKAQEVLAFLKACERQWRRASGGKLSEAQSEWLAWAKVEAARMEPFDIGYPDPALDGSFVAGAVSVGGPYPVARIWPRKKAKDQEQIKPSPQAPTQRVEPDPWSYSQRWR